MYTIDLEIFSYDKFCVVGTTPYPAYTRDNLCWKLETIFHHSVKGAE